MRFVWLGRTRSHYVALLTLAFPCSLSCRSSYDGPADGTFPQGLHQKLTKALEFEPLLDTNAGNGTSPDFDMLMIGVSR